MSRFTLKRSLTVSKSCRKKKNKKGKDACKNNQCVESSGYGTKLVRRMSYFIAIFSISIPITLTCTVLHFVRLRFE
jgi:hypothetical protein